MAPRTTTKKKSSRPTTYRSLFDQRLVVGEEGKRGKFGKFRRR